MGCGRRGCRSEARSSPTNMWVVRRGSIVLLKNWPDRDDAVGSGLHGRLHEFEFIVLDFGMCRHGRASKSSTDQRGPYGTRKSLIEPRERYATARALNRLGRFRESEILRHIFECVVAACMTAGPCQRRRIRGGRERNGGQCQPLSRQSARRVGLDRRATSQACSGRLSCWT